MNVRRPAGASGAEVFFYWEDLGPAGLRLDFTTNFQLSGRLNIFGDFINITNTPLRFYLGTPEVVKQQEFYSWWCRVGVHWRVL